VNARVIASALIPDEPVAPRKTFILSYGFLLGGLLALATAIVLEARDKSIRTG